MDATQVAELHDGIPLLASDIALEFAEEVVGDYIRSFHQEQDRKKASEKRYHQAILASKWRRQDQPPPGKKENPFDWAWVARRFPEQECLEAGLKPEMEGMIVGRVASSYNVPQIDIEGWSVSAWVHRDSLPGSYEPLFREALPLPKDNGFTDCSLTENEWLVIYWAMVEMNPETQAKSLAPRSPDEQLDDTAKFREFVRSIHQRRPIKRLVARLKAAKPDDIERFKAGRRVVIDALFRRCIGRSLQRAREKTQFALIVFNSLERPAFLPTAWGSPYWPAEDTLESVSEWLACTLEALEQWQASMPDGADVSDVVSQRIARQACENAWRLALHIRDHHGITDVPERPTDDSLSAAKRFLDNVAQAISKPTRDDDTAYRPASELWRQRSNEFPFFKDKYGKFKRCFDKIPESEIRRKSKGQRLRIHAGDWAAYWKRIDDERFKLHDTLPDEVQRSLKKEAQARGATAKR